MKEQLKVTGMTCSACSTHVENSVRKLPGIEKVSVNLLTETMQVEFDEKTIDVDKMKNAVEKAGYGLKLPEKKSENTVIKQTDDETKNMKFRLIVSIVFLVPLMVVAMNHLKDPRNAVIYVLTQMLLVLPILFVNRKFFIVGFKSLFHLSPNMDSLIALGASAAMIYGVFAMYRIGYGIGYGDMELVMRYSHDLYMESAGMILTLITVGKYLESRSKGKTSEAITKLMDLSPKTAIIELEDGSEKEIPTSELVQGTIFLVKPGSLIPADGIVIDGNSSVDEAAITGESIPIEKYPGENVVSATVNKNGFLKCEAKRVGADTTLSQIIRLVEEASASKAPIAKLADKIAGVFVPIVIGIALVAGLIWLLTGSGVEFAISTAIAVLVISCPCALGLATPVAIMVGTGVGAKNGILIKSGEALQEARSVDTVVMDKTGTITEGNLKVMRIMTYPQDMNQKKLLLLAGAMEKRSEHPLSEAVVKAAMEENQEIPSVEAFEAVAGRGITALIGEEHKRYYMGNAAYMEESGILLGMQGEKDLEVLADQGMTPLLVAGEGTLLGIIGVADTVKETSKEAIQALRHMGIKVIMLTGDNKRTARAVQTSLGIEEVIAEVLPQEKEQQISRLKKMGRKVAMIGDGINDAPALAASDVGIAIGAGTDVAMESADIVLMKSDLRDAVTAIRLSKAVIRNIKENLFWAFFYNCIGIPLAAGLLYPIWGIKLNPMFGAAAMSLSSICVVTNALRLRKFKSKFVVEKVEEIEMTTKIMIEGMMCAHCVAHVQKALEELDGVKSVQVDLEGKCATVSTDKEIDDSIFKQAIGDAGYEAVNFLKK